MALRTYAVYVKQGMTPDEGLAYVAAAGHHAEYASIRRNKETPYGAWLPASEWKRLVRPDPPLRLNAVASGLTRFDVHPPLYFSLLHVWVLIVGFCTRAGAALNVCIAALSMLCLFLLARRVLHSAPAAALVTLIWALSPNAVVTTAEARPYELLALWSILLIARTLRCLDEPGTARFRRGWMDAALLALITACGLLTHYHFALLIATCGLYATIHALGKKRRRAIRACGALIIGTSLALLLHPGFLEQVRRARSQAAGAPLFSTADRWHEVFTRYAAYFVDLDLFPATSHRIVAYTVAGALAALIFMPLIRFSLASIRQQRARAEHHRAGLAILYFFLCVAGANIGLYVAGISPPHAMDPKYPSMVWPLLAFVPVLAFRTLGRWQVLPACVVCLGLFLTDARLVDSFTRIARTAADPAPVLARATHVVVGESRRGLIPRYFVHLPDRTLVYIATDEDLLARTDRWAPHLSDGSLICSRRRLPALAAVVQPRSTLEPLPGGIRGAGPCARLSTPRP